jgi:hypothetical protein
MIQTLDGFQSGGSTETTVLPNSRSSITLMIPRRQVYSKTMDRLRQWSLSPQASLLLKGLLFLASRHPILGRLPPKTRTAPQSYMFRKFQMGI